MHLGKIVPVQRYDSHLDAASVRLIEYHDEGVMRVGASFLLLATLVFSDGNGAIMVARVSVFRMSSMMYNIDSRARRERC